MAITINGSGTITGISAGGLPDGSVTAADIESSLDLSAKTLTLPAGTGGKVLQVVNALKDDTYSTTSTSYVAVPALAASITPTSTSSKILMIVSVALGTTASQTAQWRMYKDGATLFQSTTATNTNGVGAFYTESGGNAHYALSGNSITYLNSPVTTASTTYQVWLRTTGGTAYVNRRGAANDFGMCSSITLVEIAG
jgi:hypothetical protein